MEKSFIGNGWKILASQYWVGVFSSIVPCFGWNVLSLEMSKRYVKTKAASFKSEIIYTEKSVFFLLLTIMYLRRFDWKTHRLSHWLENMIEQGQEKNTIILTRIDWYVEIIIVMLIKILLHLIILFRLLNTYLCNFCF